MASRFRSTDRFPRTSSSRRRKTHRSIRPSLMMLEDRMLLSSLVVSNTNDSGSGSLRFEIGQAAAGDTITFDPALFSGGARTVTLTSGVLNITKDVTIDGPGAKLLTISGKNS
jgi:hypothetical protein